MPVVNFRSKTDLVTLPERDSPERWPLGTTKTAGEQLLSDGSRILATTGVTAVDPTITGTIRGDDNGFTPLQKIQRIEAMVKSNDTIVVSPYLGELLVRSVGYEIIEDEKVVYTITLFRGLPGSLSASATSAATTASQQTYNQGQQIGALSPDLSPSSQSLATAYQKSLSGVVGQVIGK